MSVSLIEINDRGVSVIDHSGVLRHISPGIALLENDQVELGEAALRRTRLNPTRIINRFWSQLNLEPFSPANRVARHYADLAYLHLMHVAEQTEISSEQEVIVAVPGSFSREQLAIILGLLRQTPFKAVGMIDSALAGTVMVAESPSVLHLDLQLHQVLLTTFAESGGELQRRSVVQLGDVGLHSMYEAMVHLTTGQFIQQCRFNPQHSAAVEQELYNALPHWLSQSRHGNSLPLELNAGEKTYQAKLSWDSVVGKLEPHYRRIRAQMDKLVTADTEVVLTDAMAELPGLAEFLNLSGKTVSPAHLAEACTRHESLIRAAEATHLVWKLPANRAPATRPRQADVVGSQPPTHVLFRNSAIALGRQVDIRNGADSHLSSGSIALNVRGLPESLGRISKVGEDVFVEFGETGALLNNRPVTGRQALTLGDRIGFPYTDEDLQLIEVQDV
ncbi:MAG: hypothetical protein WDZ76_13975 [Pseudohongiellaceae bacterium]